MRGATWEGREGWGAWWSLEELQPKEMIAQLFLEAASCLEGPAVKFQHVLRLIVKKKGNVSF